VKRSRRHQPDETAVLETEEAKYRNHMKRFSTAAASREMKHGEEESEMDGKHKAIAMA